MAAKDYIIVPGCEDIFLAKRNAPTKKCPQAMSADRRVIEDWEILGLFEFYLRKWCSKNGSDTIEISFHGKKTIVAKLLDYEGNDGNELKEEKP